MAEKKKQKFTKDIVPENFTLSLVLVDALPVIFFGASAVVISFIFGSKLFLVGALLCLLGGIGKVLWKMIVVLKKKNVWAMFVQMRILMPLGFLLIIVSLIFNSSSVSFTGMWNAFISMPSFIFFFIGIIGICLMIYFSKNLDSGDVKANWIEQLTNGISQAAIFVGLLLLL